MPAPIRLLVCIGPRCDAEGRGRAQLAAVEDAMQERFPDDLAAGRLAITTRDCLRLCTSDPVLRIEPSGEAFADPAIDDLVEIVAMELDGRE